MSAVGNGRRCAGRVGWRAAGGGRVGGIGVACGATRSAAALERERARAQRELSARLRRLEWALNSGHSARTPAPGASAPRTSSSARAAGFATTGFRIICPTVRARRARRAPQRGAERDPGPNSHHRRRPAVAGDPSQPRADSSPQCDAGRHTWTYIHSSGAGMPGRRRGRRACRHARRRPRRAAARLSSPLANPPKPGGSDGRVIRGKESAQREARGGGG